MMLFALSRSHCCSLWGMPSDAVQCSPYSTVQCSAVQYSAVQYSTVQYSTVQYSAVQCSTTVLFLATHIAVPFAVAQRLSESREGRRTHTKAAEEKSWLKPMRCPCKNSARCPSFNPKTPPGASHMLQKQHQALYCTVLYYAALHCTTQHNTAQCSACTHSAVQYSTGPKVEYGTGQCLVPRLDVSVPSLASPRLTMESAAPQRRGGGRGGVCERERERKRAERARKGGGEGEGARSSSGAWDH